MVRALRRSRFVSLIAVFAMLAALPSTFAAWHQAGDDPFCDPLVIVHDHSAHRIGPETSAPDSPEHCLFCHWCQTLRGAHVAGRFVLPDAPSALLSLVVAPVLVSVPSTGRPGRAPPLA